MTYVEPNGRPSTVKCVSYRKRFFFLPDGTWRRHVVVVVLRRRVRYDVDSVGGVRVHNNIDGCLDRKQTMAPISRRPSRGRGESRKTRPVGGAGPQYRRRRDRARFPVLTTMTTVARTPFTAQPSSVIPHCDGHVLKRAVRGNAATRRPGRGRSCHLAGVLSVRTTTPPKRQTIRKLKIKRSSKLSGRHHSCPTARRFLRTGATRATRLSATVAPKSKESLVVRVRPSVRAIGFLGRRVPFESIAPLSSGNNVCPRVHNGRVPDFVIARLLGPNRL